MKIADPRLWMINRPRWALLSVLESSRSDGLRYTVRGDTVGQAAAVGTAERGGVMRAHLRRLACQFTHGFCVILTGLAIILVSPSGLRAQGGESKLTKKLIEEGITAYQHGQYDEAISKLTQARSLLPSHSPTVLYLGLAYLKQGKTTEAIVAWQEYTTLQPRTKEEQQGNLPQTIPQYLTLLLREENQRIAREAVAHEQSLGPSDPQTVAVTYYRNLGSPELGPLQKGLTALLISDISQVKELKVVERDLLQALLEELQLGATGAVDEKTAPKVGRLLGAGKVATGSYLDTGKEELRVDSLVAESATAQVINTQESSGKIEQFYELEKGLAFAILNDLGYDEQRLRAAGVYDRIRQPQTTSLPALTAFSQGLDAKDRGDYPAARTQFEQALAADPNFELARKELLTLPLVALATGGILAAVSSSAPSASAATASMAATAAAAGAAGAGLGISTTTLGIAAGVVAAGAAAGAAVSASQGDSDDGPTCGNGRVEGPREQCDDGNRVSGDCCSATCQSESVAETCNDIDDDCDGTIDDGLDQTETCGVGACEVTVQTCVDGQPQTCIPGDPGEEFVGCSGEVNCFDGIDNDCDGTVDSCVLPDFTCPAGPPPP